MVGGGGVRGGERRPPCCWPDKAWTEKRCIEGLMRFDVSRILRECSGRWDPPIIEKVQRRAWGSWTAVCLNEINYCQGVDRDIYSQRCRPPLASKLEVAFLPRFFCSLKPASSAASSLALNHIHFSGIRPSHIHTLQTSKQLSHVADSVLRVVEPLHFPS